MCNNSTLKRSIFLAIAVGVIVLQDAAAQTSAASYSNTRHLEIAHETTPIKISFIELESLLRSHPSLDALGFTAEADRARAEGALGLPDPVFSVGLNNFPIASPSFDEYLPTNKYLGVRQSFPNSAKRKAESLKSLRTAKQTELQIEMQFSWLRGELLTLLIERERIRQQRLIARERDAKFKELTEIIDIEINSGRSLVYRLTEVDVERAEVARTLSELDGQDMALDASLLNLIGAVPETIIPDTEMSKWSGNAYDFFRVRVADAAVEVSGADVQKAEADFKPEWGLNLTYQQRESGRGAPRSNFDGDDWVSGGVSFTVPLWSKRRQDPNLRAANSDRSSAVAMRMAAARQVLSEWQNFKATREVAIKNIAILKSKMLAVQDQLASKLISYESGAGDYSGILDGELAVMTFRSQLEQESARRDIATVRMNSLLVGEI